MAARKSVRPRTPADPAQIPHRRTAESGDRRPAWRGNLKLSLVSCPVQLVNAITYKEDVAFHLINPKTHNRIRMVPTDPKTGPIERSQLVKGYEIAKNEYVLVTDQELENVRLETTHAIDIERFVDVTSIDRMYWNAPYFLLPNGDQAIEAYVVIREAMQKVGRIALGRVVMHTRERLLAIESRDNGLIAYTLRTRDEVGDPAVAFRGIPAQKPDKRMVEIAESIIAQQEGPFAPQEFRDRYEDALKDLIRSKERGGKPVSAAPLSQSNVINLMDALKKSLKGKPQLHAAPVRRPARKRAR
jgi:DNA end-binding protein Ku